MAMLYDSSHVKVTYYDNQGKNASTHRRYEVGTDLTDPADIAAFINVSIPALIAASDGVSQAVITEVVFEYKIINNAVALPASNVENENTAELQIQLLDITKSAPVSIPAADPAIFVALSGDGAKVVNATNAAVIAFGAMFTGAGFLVLSDGEVASATNTVIGGRRVHKRSPKGRSKIAG